MSLNLDFSCKIERNKSCQDAFIVISPQVIQSLLTRVLSRLTFPPPQTSTCGWGGQACTRGSISTSQQITNTGQQALLSTQSTVRSTHGTTCGHVGVGVQVWGGRVPSHILVRRLPLACHGYTSRTWPARSNDGRRSPIGYRWSLTPRRRSP